MAYTPVNLLPAQVALNTPQSQFELRVIEPTTYKAIQAMTGTAVPDYEAIRTADLRVVDINTPARSVRSILTARTFNHVGNVGTAVEETLSWNQNVDVSSFTLKQSDNSTYSLDKMVTNEITNMGLNIINAVEGKAIDFIFGVRTQENASVTQGSFDPTDDVFQITDATDGEDIAQITEMVMNELAFKGQMTVFCTPVAWNKFMKLNAQGISNATNTSFAFGNLVFVKSIGLEGSTRFGGLNSAAGYPLGAWIAVPTGGLAVLDWIPVQNRNSYSDSEGSYGFLELPMLNTTVGMHSYSERADGTSTGGFQQDVKTELEMSYDTCFFDALISDAGVSVAVAFVLV